MAYRINPAFDRFPKEARLIGQLLAGFGEIEYHICSNAARAAASAHVLKALYRLRATSSRIEAADALARPEFDAAKLGPEYLIAHTMAGTCLRIRNQFAHCMWADAPGQPELGLFFTDLQAAADAADGFEFSWRHVDGSLLEKHAAYFAIAMDWHWYLWNAVKTGGPTSHAWPRPPEQVPPPFHNPPEMHVPPWLTEDQRALHLGRALAAKGGPPTPTPAQQAQERRKAEKLAHKNAERERSKRSRPEPQQ